MRFEDFRAAWDSALRASGLLTPHDRPEESVELATMSRKYFVRVGSSDRRPTGLFLGSMVLSWQWDALLSARTATTEEDMLTELLGRDDAEASQTEQPWVRVDIKFSGAVGWNQGLTVTSAETWRTWVSKVADRVDPLLPPSARGLASGGIQSWMGQPEVRMACDPSGELRLERVSLLAWQGIDLPRRRDDREATKDPDARLATFAKRLARALAAWNQSLELLQSNPELH